MLSGVGFAARVSGQGPQVHGVNTGICVTYRPDGTLTHKPCAAPPPRPRPSAPPRRPGSAPRQVIPRGESEAERRFQIARQLFQQIQYYFDESYSLSLERRRLSRAIEPLYWENQELVRLLKDLEKEFEYGYREHQDWRRAVDKADAYLPGRMELLSKAYSELLARLDNLEEPRLLILPGLLPGATASFPSLAATTEAGGDREEAFARLGSALALRETEADKASGLRLERAREMGCDYAAQAPEIGFCRERSPYYYEPRPEVAVPTPGAVPSEADIAYLRRRRNQEAADLDEAYDSVLELWEVRYELRSSLVERKWLADQYRISIKESSSETKVLRHYLGAKIREALITEAKRAAVFEATSLIDRLVPPGARWIARDSGDELRRQLDGFGRYIDSLNRMRRFAEVTTEPTFFRNLEEAMHAAIYLHIDPERADLVRDRMERSVGVMATELEELGQSWLSRNLRRLGERLADDS